MRGRRVAELRERVDFLLRDRTIAEGDEVAERVVAEIVRAIGEGQTRGRVTAIEVAWAIGDEGITTRVVRARADAAEPSEGDETSHAAGALLGGRELDS
jgi:hypothetical protein